MAQIQVNVSWREIPVFESILLSEVDGSTAFLRTKTPMPVGTMLIVSPCERQEACVPARVTGVVEIPEAGSDATQGMKVTFEAAAELLEPFLADEPEPVVGLQPEPAFETAPDPEEEEPEPQDKPGLGVPAAEEGDLPAAPRVEVVEAVEAEEPVKDSAIAPQVSGEISLEGRDDVIGDPDSPDKVIVEVDADPAEEPSSAKNEPSVAELSVEVDADPAEEPSGEADEQPKRKKRRKRRKKKK